MPKIPRQKRSSRAVSPRFIRRLSSWLVLSTTLTLGVSQRVRAATYTWNGPSDLWNTNAEGFWSTASNWSGTAPLGTDSTGILDFNLPGGYTATNDLAGAFQLNQLVFNVGVEAPALPTTVNGNQLSFSSNGQITQSGFGAFAVGNEISLANGLTFSGNGPGTVTLTGAITGTGGLTFSGFNTTVLSPSTSTSTIISSATVSGTTTVTVASTAGLSAGLAVSGVGVSGTIASIIDATHFVLSTAATASATNDLTYTATANTSLVSTATTSSTTVTVTSTSGLIAGEQVIGAGIPAGATIVSITDATHYVLSTTPTSPVTATALAYTQANTFTGTITINSGALSVASDLALGATNVTTSNANAITFGALGGGTLALTTGFATSARPVTFTGNGTFDTASGVTATLSGLLSGNGSFFKQDTGTLTLSNTGNNVGTGANYLNGGVLIVGADTNLLGANTGINFGGGTLEASPTGFSTARSIGLFTAGTIDVVTGQTLTATGAISGSGSLTKTDAGTLVINNGSGANTYTGGTTLLSGTNSILTLSSAGGLGNAGGALTITVGTLNLNANQSVGNFSGAATGILDLGAGATLTITGAGTGAAQTFAGNIPSTGGSGSLVMSGTGTLTLTGTNNTWTGTTTINSGVITYSTASDAALPATAASITVNSGGAAASGIALDQTFLGKIAGGSAGVVALGAASAGALDFSSAGANLTAASLGATGAFAFTGTLVPNGTTYRLGGGGGVLTMTTALTGASNSLVIGTNGTATTGSVVLTTATTNSYGGGTVINAGTLSVGADINLGASATNIILNGGALLGNTTFTTSARAITLAGGAINAASGMTLTLAGALGGGALNVNSNTNGAFQTGTVVLNAADGFTGGTTVNAGTLTMGIATALNGGSGGSLTINSNNGATVLNTFNNAGANTAQTINNLSGSFISGANAITLAFFANTVTVNETSNTAYNGIITGITTGTGANLSNLTLSATSTGTLTLNGLDTYGGSITAYTVPSTSLLGGTLSVGRDPSLGTVPSAATASSIVLNGGALNAYESFTINSLRGIGLGVSTTNVTGTGGTITVAPGQILTYGGILANNATTTTAASISNLTVGAAGQTGTLLLTGANTFGGSGATINLNAGTLSILLDTALGSTSNTLTFNGGSLLTTTLLGLADSKLISVSAGGATVNVNGPGGTIGVNGNDNGLGTYNVSGAGTPSLVTVPTNVLQFAPLAASTLNATTLSGVISGAGNTLTVNSGGQTGTLILSGTNTFGGATTANQEAVDGGVLAVAADLNLGAAPTSVVANSIDLNNGATLLVSVATITIAANRGITLGAGGGVIDAATGTDTIAGIIAGTNSLSLNSGTAGTVALGGVNTFGVVAGGSTVNINGGVVSIAADSGLGTANNTITFNGGQLLIGTGTFTSETRNIILATGGALNLGAAWTQTGGTISGAGALTKLGASTLSLAAGNTYTGPTFISSASTVVTGADSDLGSTSGTPGAVIFNLAGATLNTTATFATARALDFLTNETLIANTGTTLTLNGSVAVSNGVTLTINNTTTGATTFAPAGANSVFFNPTSTLTITNGAVTLGAANELPFNGAVTVNGGTTGSLNLNGFNEIVGSLTSAASSPITTTGAGTTVLTVGQLNTATTTAAGNIVGNIQLIKVGAGTLVLSGTNTFNGGLVIDGGVVSAAVAANLGTTNNSITLTGGGELSNITTTIAFPATQSITVNGFGDFDNATGINPTIAGAFSGSGIVGHTGAGQLIFQTSSNTFTGGYVSASGAGAIIVNNATGLGASTNTVLEDGAFTANTGFTSTIGGLAGYSGTTTLTGGLTDNQATNTTFAGLLAGAGAFIKLGNGTLTLTNTGSTYTGAFTVGGGTLVISQAINLGSSTAGTLSGGGILQINDSGFTTSKSFTMGAGGGSIDVTGGNFAAISGNFTGAGALTKTDTGTLFLTGTNTNNGLNINGGTVSTATSVSLSTGAALTFNGGTLQMTGAGQTSTQNVTLNAGGGIIDVTGANIYTLSGNITGAGNSLTKIDTGTLTLSGTASSYATTVVNGGVLQATALASGNAFGGSNVTLNGGALQLNQLAGTTTNTTIATLNFSGGTLAINGSGTTQTTLTVNNFNRVGTGTLIFQAVTGHLGAGGEDFSAPSLNALAFGLLPADFVIQDRVGTTFGDFATVDGTAANNVAVASYTANSSGTIGTPGGISANSTSGNAVFDVNQSDALTNPTGNVYALTVEAGKILTLSGNLLTIGANAGAPGGLILNGGTIGSGMGDGTLAFSGEGLIYVGGASTINSNITGAGGLTFFGPQSVVLGGNNSGLTGAITVNGAILSVSADNNLGFVGVGEGGVLLNGGTLQVTGGFSSARSVSLGAAGGTFNVGSGQMLTLSNVSGVSGTGGLTLTGGGTLILSSPSNSYAGGTFLTSGTLAILSDSAIPAGNITFNGVGTNTGALLYAPLTTGNLLTTARNFILPATSTAFGAIDTTLNNTLVVTGQISGAGGLTTLGNAGTVVLFNAANIWNPTTPLNTYTGTTTIAGGTLVVPFLAEMGATSGLIFNGGSLRTSSYTFANAVTATGAGTIDVAAAQSTVFTGAITGAGALTKIGTGTLTLTPAATSNFTGGYTLDLGTLVGTATAAIDPFGASASVITLNGGNLTITSAASTIIVTNPINVGGNATVTATTAAMSVSSGTLTLGGQILTVTGGAAAIFAPSSVVLNSPLSTISNVTAVAIVTTGGTVTGTGALNKAGTGTVNLNGVTAGGYSGGTNILAGVLNIGASGVLPSTGGVIVNPGGILGLNAAANVGAVIVNVASTTSSAGIVTLNTDFATGTTLSNAVFGVYGGVVDMNVATNFNSAIDMSKFGAANNTSAGNPNLFLGAAQNEASTSTGIVPAGASGSGVYRLGANATGATTLTLSSSGALAGAGNSVIIGSPLADPTGAYTNGTGTVVLSATTGSGNTYTGSTTVNKGSILNITSTVGAPLGTTGAVNVYGALSDSSAVVTVANQLSNLTYNLFAGGSMTVDNTLVATAANTARLAAAATLNLNTASFTYTGASAAIASAQTVGAITFGGGDQIALNKGSAGTATTLTSSAALVRANQGTLQLSGTGAAYGTGTTKFIVNGGGAGPVQLSGTTANTMIAPYYIMSDNSVAPTFATYITATGFQDITYDSTSIRHDRPLIR